MNYKISVKEFLELSEKGEIDYDDFSAKATDEADKLQKKYNFFRFINKKKPKSGPNLHGLPVSVKDCICVKDMTSSAGSKILEDYKPPFDATSIKRIKEKGAFIIGKTNQDEFGFGTFSTNCAYGAPKNPLDTQRSCGGSSGGAAGYTAATEFPHIAIGESTGGSISCPAAFCGVVGLTPTYGLVSRYGLIDYANSLDKIGTMGKSVYDAALMLSVISGHDEKDSTSINIPKKNYHDMKEISKPKIGVPKEYFLNLDKKIEKATWNAIKKLESEGAKIVDISLPTTKHSVSAYYIIATAEASTNLAKYCGMRYGVAIDLQGSFNEYFSAVRSRYFGEEAKRRIMLGTFARMSGYRKAYYLKAMSVRTMIINDFKKALKKVDIIAAPTMPILPPRFTEIEKLTPLQCYQMDLLTLPANLAGMPMISVPCGEMTGLHIIGDHLQEEKIISVADRYEQVK